MWGDFDVWGEFECEVNSMCGVTSMCGVNSSLLASMHATCSLLSSGKNNASAFGWAAAMAFCSADDATSYEWVSSRSLSDSC